MREIEAGRILIYPSDYIHGVRPVTSGVRKCVTFWMESSIPDPTMRFYITEFNKLFNKIHEADRDVLDRGFGYVDKETLLLLDHVRCGITKRCIQMRN